jgi:hypothetical protein
MPPIEEKTTTGWPFDPSTSIQTTPSTGTEGSPRRWMVPQRNSATSPITNQSRGQARSAADLIRKAQAGDDREAARAAHRII